MKHGLAWLALVGTFGVAHAFTPLAGPSATTFQLNPAHDGTTTFDPPLSRRLVELWRYDVDGPLSYPLIADGRVFIAYTNPTGPSQNIVALDEASGATLWGPIELSAAYYFAGTAYDDGRVFTLDNDGLLQTFDAASGELDWSVQVPDQWSYTSPPSATNGIVYVGGSGSGGTVYAFDESNGALLWTQLVENGDDSSPAVADGDVFVSYACAQVYSFDATSGAPHWHFSGSCEGGGGATPVVRDQRLYVRDWTSSPTGYIFDSVAGNLLDRFDAQTIPAIGVDTGYFLQAGTLRGIRLDDLSVRWSFAGDGALVTAPIVVDTLVFVGSQSGALYALDATTGHVSMSLDTGAPIVQTVDGGPLMPSGLAAGDGLVLVPTTAGMVAYAEVGDAIFADGFESP